MATSNSNRLREAGLSYSKFNAEEFGFEFGFDDKRQIEKLKAPTYGSQKQVIEGVSVELRVEDNHNFIASISFKGKTETKTYKVNGFKEIQNAAKSARAWIFNTFLYACSGEMEYSSKTSL